MTGPYSNKNDLPHPISRAMFVTQLLLLAGLPLGGGQMAWGRPAPPMIHAWWQPLVDGVPYQALHDEPPRRGRPGSLMKLVAAAALSEQGLIPPERRLDCPGSLHFSGSPPVHCPMPHGRLNLVQALGHSCNVYFAQACQALPEDVLRHTMERLGLPLPRGRFVSPQDATTGSLAMVLGLADTMQFDALALLGLARRIARRKGTFSPATWDLLQNGMRLAARDGTARKLDPADHYRLAVKTGTTPHGPGFQSWLIGYFPFEAPRYAFCLRALSGTSQEAAVPQARQFLATRSWP